jgi:uncharacterized glyoxalase superfamily protein PhnB
VRTTFVQLYVHYPGTCREALDLCIRAIGARAARILTGAAAPPDPAYPVAATAWDLMTCATLIIHGTLVMCADASP